MFVLRFCLLFVTWCAFSGHFDFYHLFLGALASAWVAGVTNHIALAQPNNHRPVSRVELMMGLTTYFGWLMIQIFKANIQVLKLSFAASVKQEISPCVFEFYTKLPDDFSRFVLAHSITLTPGTVTIRVDGDRFIVHALTESMADDVPGEMERRLLSLFGAETVVDQSPDDLEKDADTGKDSGSVSADGDEGEKSDD